MVHGDDKGLVLPPRVAPIQVVVIPIPFKGLSTEELTAASADITKQLREAGLRVKEDARENYSPGWKYSHHELKGVPLRLELGPKDLEKKQVREGGFGGCWGSAVGLPAALGALKAD